MVQSNQLEKNILKKEILFSLVFIGKWVGLLVGIIFILFITVVYSYSYQDNEKLKYFNNRLTILNYDIQLLNDFIKQNKRKVTLIKNNEIPKYNIIIKNKEEEILKLNESIWDRTQKVILNMDMGYFTESKLHRSITKEIKIISEKIIILKNNIKILELENSKCMNSLDNKQKEMLEIQYKINETIKEKNEGTWKDGTLQSFFTFITGVIFS